MKAETQYISILLGATLLTSAIDVNAQDDRKLIRQGNNRYSDSKFQDAEVYYRKALEKNNASANASFNLGDALYKQNKFSDASKQFEGIASAATDDEKKANSFYNLGNSLLKENKFAEAAGAYKNSLKLVPDNKQAKYNLAYAQDMLKEQQDKNDKNKDMEPSEFAKKLKAEADKLIATGNFIKAYNLMQDGLKKDETVAYYNDFIQKTGKVARIESLIK